MKRLILSTLSVSLCAITPLLASAIMPLHVKEDISKTTLHAPLWQKAKMAEVLLYPQTTIEMNDKELIKANAKNKAKRLKVKVAQNASHVAFWLEWKDAKKDLQEGYSSTAYGDGVAVQFATQSDKLPYIGMGSDGRAVVVHLQKATGVTYAPDNGGDIYHQLNVRNQNAFEGDVKAYAKASNAKGNADYQRVFVAEGFRSTTQIRDDSEPARMEMHYANGTWKALLVRPLKSAHVDLSQGSFPVAFALWDGAKKNRDGSKVLSSWVGVGQKPLVALDELKGDVKNGESIMMENCAACHHYKAVKNAPNYMAPDLSNIGGYANASYLLESIVDPSAVVVPGYNTTAHPAFPWYSVDKGVRSSTMPPFAHLDEKSLKDLVAFMKTLKVEVEK